MKAFLAMLTVMMFMVFGTFQAEALTVSSTTVKNAGATQSINVKWTSLRDSGTDTAVAFKTANYKSKSVQIDGTFSSATVTIQGSNNGTSWTTLTDQSNTALTCTAACLKTIQQDTLYVRPSVSGTVSSSIIIDMHLKP